MPACFCPILSGLHVQHTELITIFTDLGYQPEDILALVKVETLPQHSVSKLAPVGEELASGFWKIL